MSGPRKHKYKPNGYSRSYFVGVRLDPVENHFITTLAKEMGMGTQGREMSKSEIIRILIREKALPILLKAGMKPEDLDRFIAEETTKHRSAKH